MNFWSKPKVDFRFIKFAQPGQVSFAKKTQPSPFSIKTERGLYMHIFDRVVVSITKRASKRFMPEARGLIICIVMVFVTGFAWSSTSASDIAFFYALDADFKTFSSVAIPVGQPTKVGGHRIQKLELGAHRIYAVKMGSGPVETAVSAASLLARFRCDSAFSIGPVGALSNSIKLGEWYRVNQVRSYQKGSWQSSGFQVSKPEVPGARATEPFPEDQSQVPGLFTHLAGITVASGEVFVASSSYRESLSTTTSAEAVDMNLFGLETACGKYNVPLRSWRIVSDRADDSAGETFRAFVTHYDGAGGRALAEILRHLPVNPNSPEAYPAIQRLIAQPTASPIP